MSITEIPTDKDMYFSFKTGQRVLVKGTTKVSDIIDHTMRKYARQEGIPDTYTFSHSGTIVIINGRIRIVEAVANGLCPNLFFEHYNLLKDDIMIVEPREGISPKERDLITEYALDLIAVNNFYQYWSLICWLAYVHVAFKWKGKYRRLNIFGKGNKFSNVCYEATYLIAKRCWPVEFPKNPEHGTCYDLYRPEKDFIVYSNQPFHESIKKMFDEGKVR